MANPAPGVVVTFPAVNNNNHPSLLTSMTANNHSLGISATSAAATTASHVVNSIIRGTALQLHEAVGFCIVFILAILVEKLGGIRVWWSRDFEPGKLAVKCEIFMVMCNSLWCIHSCNDIEMFKIRMYCAYCTVLILYCRANVVFVLLQTPAWWWIVVCQSKRCE